jgi:hypothetical protein
MTCGPRFRHEPAFKETLSEKGNVKIILHMALRSTTPTVKGLTFPGKATGRFIDSDTILHRGRAHRSLILLSWYAKSLRISGISVTLGRIEISGNPGMESQGKPAESRAHGSFTNKGFFL